MGHNGQLARSKAMGAPLVSEDGKQTYDLGKMWIGTTYEVQGKFNDKEKKYEMEEHYRYSEDRIAEKFLQPQPVCWATTGRKQVVSVACGELHLLVVARDEGKDQLVVYSSGHNQYGQLGHGDHEQRHELTPVSDPKPVIDCFFLLFQTLTQEIPD
jgi:alpha-tubulin suppressor-like RCC1 family protein